MRRYLPFSLCHTIFFIIYFPQNTRLHLLRHSEYHKSPRRNPSTGSCRDPPPPPPERWSTPVWRCPVPQCGFRWRTGWTPGWCDSSDLRWSRGSRPSCRHTSTWTRTEPDRVRCGYGLWDTGYRLWGTGYAILGAGYGGRIMGYLQTLVI